MFFGMSNSPASFQQFINMQIMEEFYQKFGELGSLQNYMDDFRLGTLLKDIDLHIKMIHFLFNLLTKHRIHLKLSKSIFMQLQMDFLGARISKDGVTVNPAKIAGLAEYPQDILNL